MDKLTPEQRRKCMQAVKGRDTLPEVIVRKWLHAHGYRFRVCDKRIVGHPDVVLPRLKTLIEIRGCFWHHHGWECGAAGVRALPFFRDICDIIAGE